jgi:hypothetical protein
LERFGDADGALKLILADVDRKFEALKSYLTENLAVFLDTDSKQTIKVDPSLLEVADEYVACSQVLDVAVALCQRSLDGASLWFRVLDHFMRKNRKEKTEANFVSVLSQLKRQPQAAVESDDVDITCLSRRERKETVLKTIKGMFIVFIQKIMQSMLGHVPLQAILEKITTDHANDELHEFRDTITSLIDTYRYEENILSTASKLVAGDMFNLVREFRDGSASAFIPKQDACGVCNRSLAHSDVQSNVVVLGRCGHSFHRACMSEESRGMCMICTFESSSEHERKARSNPVRQKGKDIVQRMRDNLANGGGLLQNSSSFGLKAAVVFTPNLSQQDTGSTSEVTEVAADEAAFERLQLAKKRELLQRLMMINNRGSRESKADTYDLFKTLSMNVENKAISEKEELKLAPTKVNIPREVYQRNTGQLPKAETSHRIDTFSAIF